MGERIKDYGENAWFGHFLVDTIDQILEARSRMRRGESECEHVVNIKDIILASLIKHIPDNILSGIKIEFVKPENGHKSPEDPNLNRIELILGKEFGQELVNRIRLHLETKENK